MPRSDDQNTAFALRRYVTGDDRNTAFALRKYAAGNDRNTAFAMRRHAAGNNTALPCCESGSKAFLQSDTVF